MNTIKEINNDIIIYTNNTNDIKIDVLYNDENVWLSLNRIAELFGKDKSVISRHIKNIYNEEELDRKSTVAFFATVQKEGNRQITRNIEYYNLDMIIAVGYRVNSKIAIKFRKWATNILKSYMIKGFAVDYEGLSSTNRYDAKYFDELYQIIKTIRASERKFYQKITDIFSECSIDYDKTSEIAQEFFATIQNKFHYAITHQTAAEIISARVDSTKKYMGLTAWKKSPKGRIQKFDVSIAKNYFSEEELEHLADIVNMYLDIAENRAKRHIIMKMENWISILDNMLKMNEYKVLNNKGIISNEEAKEKAELEYEKYKVIQDSNYMSDFDELVNIVTKKDVN